MYSPSRPIQEYVYRVQPPFPAQHTHNVYSIKNPLKPNTRIDVFLKTAPLAQASVYFQIYVPGSLVAVLKNEIHDKMGAWACFGFHRLGLWRCYCLERLGHMATEIGFLPWAFVVVRVNWTWGSRG